MLVFLEEGFHVQVAWQSGPGETGSSHPWIDAPWGKRLEIDCSRNTSPTRRRGLVSVKG